LHLKVLRTATLTAFAAAILVVEACSVGGQAVGGGDATISIASPANGAQVTIPFDVQLSSSVPLGPPETGNHHAHLYFDTGTDATDYDIVYGNTWQVTRQLAPGEHTIILAMANPDHSLAGPTQTFKVTVGGSGGGSGGGSAPPAPSQPGITY
jgi:hypothetical protein